MTKKRIHPKPPDPPVPRLRYSIRELAGALNVSQSTVWKRVYSGDLKTVRDGNRHFVTPEEAKRYAWSNNRKPVNQK